MSKYIEVKFLKAHPKYAYSAGNSGVIDIRVAYKLVRRGFVRIQYRTILKRLLRAVWSHLWFSKGKI
jgi:hypothetical protein